MWLGAESAAGAERAKGAEGAERAEGADGAEGAGAPEAQPGRTSSRSSQVRRPRSSRRLATRLIGMGRHFIHTSLFSSDCARGGKARVVAAGPVRGRRRVGGRRRHAPCGRARCRRSAGPPAPAPTPRRRPARGGRGVQGERLALALSAPRAAGCQASRPGLAPACESSPPPRAAPRPPGRGWRCGGRTSDSRQGLGRGAGRGLGRAGRGVGERTALRA